MYFFYLFKASVQFSSVAQSCPTLCDPMNCRHARPLSITNSQSLPKPMSMESGMPSNHLILCHPHLLLPSIFPSIRVFFQWVSSSHQVAKVSEFQLQHQSFQWREVKVHYENGPWHLWRGPPPEKLCFKLLLFKDIDKGETSRSFREGESRRDETAGRKHSTWPIHYCG